MTYTSLILPPFSVKMSLCERTNSRIFAAAATSEHVLLLVKLIFVFLDFAGLDVTSDA